MNIRDHVGLKRPGVLRAQALEAIAESTAFTLIDAIDPDRGGHPAHYEIVKDAFDAMAPFEAYAGGVPSKTWPSTSRTRRGSTSRRTGSRWPLRWSSGRLPAPAAVRGVCRILNRAHISFGVITRRQLGQSRRYGVLVLPNVVRMDAEEVDGYPRVRARGGRVYASRYTSLVETRGVRHDDFMLADVFGVRLDRRGAAVAAYVKPRPTRRVRGSELSATSTLTRRAPRSTVACCG